MTKRERLYHLFSKTKPKNNRMQEKNIQPRVIEIIMRNLGVKEELVTLEANLQFDLGADSLDKVELVISLEDEFKISIPDDFPERVFTVQQTINWVEERCANKK